MYFTEKEAIPSDADTVGHTWAKSNKDGSPDRRFRGNYQIPVVHYGELSFTSPDGLAVKYQCSVAALAKRFATAWAAFRMSFNVPQTADHIAYKPTEPFATHQRVIRAFDRFNAANEKFLSSVVIPTCKVTMLKEDFMAYMATVVELIDAANEHVEDPDISPSIRGRCRSAIERFALSRIQFEIGVRDGVVNKEESYIAYSDALCEFLRAIDGTLKRTEPTDRLAKTRRLAEEGNVAAQYALGDAYYYGHRGVSQDYAEGMKWFHKAADAGEVWAQLHLGLAFGKGRGVPLDYVQAHMWLTLSASSASFEYQNQSANARDDVAKDLTPAQLEEAQRLAREWRPKK